MLKLSRRDLALAVLATTAPPAGGRASGAPYPQNADGLNDAMPRDPGMEDSRRLLDPELALALRRGFPPGVRGPTPTLAQLNAMGRPVVVEVRLVSATSTSKQVPVLIVTPTKGAPGRPGLLMFHGGGFVGGQALREARTAMALAEKIGCTVVSVDYGLAPTTRFPGPLNDARTALNWFHESAEALGVDRARIAVYGVDAGAGLAVLLAARARDRGEAPIRFLCLREPMLDDRTGSVRDPGPFNGEFVWTRRRNSAGWEAFLGASPGHAGVPHEAVPARLDNLAGLPPTFIGVGSLDLFAQESLDFAARLIRSGVPTELHVYPGAFHGSAAMAPEAAVSGRYVEAVHSALRTAFSRAGQS